MRLVAHRFDILNTPPPQVPQDRAERFAGMSRYGSDEVLRPFCRSQCSGDNYAGRYRVSHLSSCAFDEFGTHHIIRVMQYGGWFFIAGAAAGIVVYRWLTNL
jgi:hypothetical protein